VDCLRLMKQQPFKTAAVAILSALLIALSACTRKPTSPQAPPASNRAEASPSSPLAQGSESSMAAVRFLEERVKYDADDIVALNKLSAYYLQLHRETDDVNYLERALHAAEASLRVLPADQNLGGLRALAHAEYETHNFVSARDHAKELTEYEPRSSFGFQLLGDALVELGDYDGATTAYASMEKLDRGSVATEARLAHLAFLRGETGTARKRYEVALHQARAASLPSAETIAWCHWQIGELEAATGRYDQAEQAYRKALDTYTDYPHALASLALVRAGRGDVPAAIETLEKVVRKHSDPVDAVALGDLFKISAREDEAERQYDAAERWSQQTKLHAALYNRHLVMFWVNHDRNLDKAYELASKEYETRRDVYGADALAWAALKAGKIDKAQSAMKEALRLKTQDARLFYHAGMIARAAGDRVAAADFLQRAVKLNPHFDPWQSKIAANALKETALFAAR